jgi:transposase
LFLNGQVTRSAQMRPQRIGKKAAQPGGGSAGSSGLQPARQRGFPCGSAHPNAVRAAYKLQNKARRTEAAARRRVAALAKFNPHGVQLTRAGVRGPLSSRERALVLHAVRVRGTSQLEAGAAAGVSQQAVSRLLKRDREAESASPQPGLEGAASPAAVVRNVKRRSSGRPSLLTGAAAADVLDAFKKDPYGGVATVHKAVLEQGWQVSPRTLYNWMAELRVQLRAANTYAPLNERLIHGLYNHIEAVEAAMERGDVELKNLVFVDQTPVFMMTGHSSGYGASLVFGDGGDAKGGKKIGNIWALMSVNGCERAWFTTENGDETTAKQFFLSDELPAGWINLYGPDGNVFDLIAALGRRMTGRCRKMILLIDRLGKSGASAYPIAGHHHPILRVRAHEAGVLLLMLPPKGALVNPIELWNMHVKRVMNHMQPAGLPLDSWQQYIRGPRTKEEALEMLKQAVVDINANPGLLRWCYHARATGQDLKRRLENHSVAVAVRAARAAQPVAPFDVIAAGRAPRARMATDHPYPPSRQTAETYNTYFYLHHHYGLHEGLPPPFVRPVDKDGWERECRLCSVSTKASQARALLAVCCDTCPGLYHHECLGLEGPPAGAWQCAACVRGDIAPLRVWKKPKPPPGTEQPAAERERKRRRKRPRADSDSE